MCCAEIGAFADQLRSAVAHAAHQVDSSWSATGSTAGSTLTLAMVTGQLLTIANVGDSTGVLDTGARGQNEEAASRRLGRRLAAPGRLGRGSGCWLAGANASLLVGQLGAHT